ncbi:hypothetical protein K505DRAFT_380622 [Melanomma pulvis-pyrius CBS 109.77]|uniref:Uncharacterized protein n=1 Tax=Melanomma pulvis-pyrius CBS 109.77 TaxID=1314802 RepID=A0A6A6WP53_9PLEO|nr:hypothetical protein K505DRAFT_380622 [Melanomma pulvis-pyrius CBS 109.77]
MQWPVWLCRALCATLSCSLGPRAHPSSQLAVVERLEVTTFVTQYLSAAVTTTVTLTVGVVATPVPRDYALPDVPTAIPAAVLSRPGPYDYSDTATSVASARTLFAVSALLTSLGQWASEPICVTPWQIFKALLLLCLATSFPFFYRAKFYNRYYLGVVFEDLRLGLVSGSNILWFFILYLVHSLTADTNRVSAFAFLAAHLANMADTHPGILVSCFAWIGTWWNERHCRQGYGLFVALWREVQKPLGSTCLVFLCVFVQATHQLPEVAAMLLDTYATVAVAGFTVAGHSFLILAWIYRFAIRGPLVMLALILQHVVTKAWPTRALAAIQFWLTIRFGPSRLTAAANLTLGERIALLDLVDEQRELLDAFNAKTVVALGERCVQYRETIQALIKDDNYLRRCLDAICNHAILQQYGNRALAFGVNTERGPVRSARFQFTPALSAATGLFYDLSLSAADKALYPLDACFGHRVLRGKGFRRFAFNSALANSGVGYVDDLFQKDAWGLEARFPGVQLPAYDSPGDPFAARCSPRDEAPLVTTTTTTTTTLLEDRVLAGEAMDVFAEMMEREASAGRMPGRA